MQIQDFNRPVDAEKLVGSGRDLLIALASQYHPRMCGVTDHEYNNDEGKILNGEGKIFFDEHGKEVSKQNVFDCIMEKGIGLLESVNLRPEFGCYYAHIAVRGYSPRGGFYKYELRTSKWMIEYEIWDNKRNGAMNVIPADIPKDQWEMIFEFLSKMGVGAAR